MKPKEAEKKPMIIFKTSNGQKFEYPHELKDITLKQYLTYLDLVQPQRPEILLKIDSLNDKLIQAQEENDKKGTAQFQKELDEAIASIDDIVTYQKLFPYYAKVVSYWSGMPESVILGKGENEGMNTNDLTNLYLHITKILNDLPTVEYSNVIEVDGEFWYLPEQYLKNATVIEFAESSQFLANMKKVEGGQWYAISKIMCVLVRKKDEKYNDSLLRREEMFLGWNLENVWRVAFFLLRLNAKYQLSINNYISAQQLTKLRLALKN